jgi:hypothetical protein
VKFRSLILISVTFVLLGISLHNYNLASLLPAVEKSEATMESFDFRNVPTRVTTESGSLIYCPGGKQSSDCSWDAESVWNNWVKRTLSPDAEKVRQQLLIDRVSIERVGIFPFFGVLNQSKARYLDHVDAWISYTESFAKCDNIQCYNSIPKTNNVSPSFKIAEAFFLDSLWISDLPSLKTRVRNIFQS